MQMNNEFGLAVGQVLDMAFFGMSKITKIYPDRLTGEVVVDVKGDDGGVARITQKYAASRVVAK